MSNDNRIIAAEKAHRESDDRYAQIIKNSLDMIFTLNSEGVFMFLSPSFEQIMGYQVSQMLGRDFRVFIHPDDVAMCTSYLDDIISTGQAKYGPEYRVSYAGGGWRWHTVSGSAVQDKDGGFLYFIGVARDITEHKQIERTLLDSYNKLEELVGKRTDELKNMVREQAREINQRKLLEAELKSARKHLEETVAQLQTAVEAERKGALLEAYDEISSFVSAFKMEVEWLSRSARELPVTVAGRIGEISKIVQQLDDAVALSRYSNRDRDRTGLALNKMPEAAIVQPLHDNLSDNELMVMKYITAGRSIKQIAHEMGIQPSTASTYRSRLLRKLKVSSDVGLVRYGIEHGIVA